VATQQATTASPVNIQESPALPATRVAVENTRAANPTMNNRMITTGDIIELSTARLRHIREGPQTPARWP